MTKHYVYEHIRLDTKAPFYVGKGCRKRAFERSGRNPHWKNVAAKHGYSVRIVIQDLSEELALLVEQELIDQRRRCGIPLVNMTDGGEGMSGWTPSQVTRSKMSAAQRVLQNEPSTKTKNASRALAMWDNPVMQAKISAAIRDAVGTSEVRAKNSSMSRANHAKPHVKVKHIAATRAALNNPETKAKMSAARIASKRRKLICIETGSVFDSVVSAVSWLQQTGQHRADGSHICKAASGKRKTAFGYNWKFIKEESNGSQN